MKIFDIHDSETGELLAFEVRNLLVTRWGLARIVRDIPNAKIVRIGPNEWYPDSGERLAFDVDDVSFAVMEPFADNSRLWIGPVPPRVVPQVAAVRSAFARSTILSRLLPAAS
jgi:hypothetical protein